MTIMAQLWKVEIAILKMGNSVKTEIFLMTRDC